MPVGITITADARATIATLRVFRERAVPFGVKKGLDDAGFFLKERISEQWGKQMDARRKSFPRSVLRVRRAKVVPGGVTTSRVYNASADEALRAQTRGATRRPAKSRFFYVPAGGRRSRKVPPNAFVSNNAVFVRQKRGLKWVGTMAADIRVPAQFSIAPAVRRARHYAPKAVEKALREELRQQALRAAFGKAVRPPPVKRSGRYYRQRRREREGG